MTDQLIRLGSIPLEYNAPLPDPLPPHAPGTIFVRPHYAHVDLNMNGVSNIRISPNYGQPNLTKILIETPDGKGDRVLYIHVLPALSPEELKAEHVRKVQYIEDVLDGKIERE